MTSGHRSETVGGVFVQRRVYSVPLAHQRTLLLGDRPLVMGIVNVTPDSFADVRPGDARTAIESALQMVEDGADLLDIGGESTRPGASPVSAAEELSRVLPVIRALAPRIRIPISVDTYKAHVARVAVAEGATIVNDVSALRHDPDLAGVVADTGAGLVLMHMRGRSSSMYEQASYRDLLSEVVGELSEGVGRATASGVTKDRIILDPGIGFAKRPAHSYGVLAHLSELAASLDRPVLVGPSRKSFMAEILGNRPPHERDWGTAAAVASAVYSGAHVVRVHSVGAMVQVVRVAEEIRKAAFR